MSKTSSFRNYLERSKERAARTLLGKAYLANRIAKVSVGKQREKLYELKGRYLSKALRLTPRSFLVDSRTPLGSRDTLLGITTNAGFRFHVVINENAEQTRAVCGSGGDAELAA